MCLEIITACGRIFRIVLSFEGESIEREKTAEVLIEIVIENAGELRHEVADVHSGTYTHTHTHAPFLQSVGSAILLKM